MAVTAEMVKTLASSIVLADQARYLGNRLELAASSTLGFGLKNSVKATNSGQQLATDESVKFLSQSAANRREVSLANSVRSMNETGGPALFSPQPSNGQQAKKDATSKFGFKSSKS